LRRGHFAAFVPHCPRCAGAAAGRHPLLLASVFAEQDDDVRAGMLHCSNAACRHEYPIIDGIPLILPRLRTLLAERGVELFLRDDLAEPLESLLGDAIGPNSWFDVMRQTISTYAWDGWADLDPEEPAPDATAPAPGAARRCLDALLALAGDAPAGRVLDLGCGAGRTTFDLAARHPEALVLGIDVNLALLRLAHGAMRGRICYPRRRIGLVYDRRAFAVDLPAAARVDFWACDAAALPFEPGAAALIAALNLLDCVPDPAALLAALGTALRPADGCCLPHPTTGRPGRRRWKAGSAGIRSAERMAAPPSRACARCSAICACSARLRPSPGRRGCMRAARSPIAATCWRRSAPARTG